MTFETKVHTFGYRRTDTPAQVKTHYEAGVLAVENDKGTIEHVTSILDGGGIIIVTMIYQKTVV